MKNIIKRILREQLNPIKWVKPDYEDEEEEFELTASEIGDDYEETLSSLINGYWNSTIEVLTDEEWSQMENTDSWELSTEEDIYRIIGHYGRSKERILKHSLEPIRNGGVVETPIVAYTENYPPYLIAGNTRLSACKVLGITPMVTKIYL
tara:strand:+ start:7251 stop:7700 length:450 start_codon:yes stop_codon:yes gene_type:complete